VHAFKVLLTDLKKRYLYQGTPNFFGDVQLGELKIYSGHGTNMHKNAIKVIIL
jgi:hypothetical protein